MKQCSKCKQLKNIKEFYKRGDSERLRSECIPCNKNAQPKVSNWRRNVKLRLVQYHGGKCTDCGYIGPPYQYDFDHRDPSEKTSALSQYKVGWDKLLQESLKCDLVCSRCHRDRTHKQRCDGCHYCLTGSAEAGESEQAVNLSP